MVRQAHKKIFRAAIMAAGFGLLANCPIVLGQPQAPGGNDSKSNPGRRDAVDHKNRFVIPRDLQQAVERLKAEMAPSNLSQFKNLPEAEAVENFHLTTGSWIRNHWIKARSDSPLTQWFLRLGIKNPDDMSAIVLCSLWRTLHEQPIKLDEQLANCRKGELYDAPQITERRPVSKAVWDAQLTSAGGQTFSLADYKGTCLAIALIYVDSSSREAIGVLDSLRARISTKKLQIVAIASSSTPLTAAQKAKIIDEFKPAFSVVFQQPENFDAEFRSSLIDPGDLEIPSVIIIGRDGNMVTRFNGWRNDTARLLEQAVESAVRSR
jgi:hypothetical protein